MNSTFHTIALWSLFLGLLIMLAAGVSAFRKFRSFDSLLILVGSIITILAYTSIQLGIPSYPSGIELAEESYILKRALFSGLLQVALGVGHLLIAVGVFKLVQRKNT
ncbi:hypothetical protein [Microbulbifer sp. 2205BS26-8]|uniref:hypothetical protein n=1 Tax=Microbulbifer sp. 2205BS26-8 TaxID=3064386 RepID=UPI00273D67F9|nr:hypothetical protein [Microbulbifer sp. 2205BS26-8]MDP5211131.1 hypothetical protein [Microbulbifer sp. 2205BS26-8]